MLEPLKWPYYTYFVVAAATILMYLASAGAFKTEVQEVKLTSISDDLYIFKLVNPASHNAHVQEFCTITPKANWKFLHKHRGTKYKANVQFTIFGNKYWIDCKLTENSEERFQQAILEFNKL